MAISSSPQGGYKSQTEQEMAAYPPEYKSKGEQEEFQTINEQQAPLHSETNSPQRKSEKKDKPWFRRASYPRDPVVNQSPPHQQDGEKDLQTLVVQRTSSDVDKTSRAVTPEGEKVSVKHKSTDSQMVLEKSKSSKKSSAASESSQPKSPMFSRKNSTSSIYTIPFISDASGWYKTPENTVFHMDKVTEKTVISDACEASLIRAVPDVEKCAMSDLHEGLQQGLTESFRGMKFSDLYRDREKPQLSYLSTADPGLITVSVDQGLDKGSTFRKPDLKDKNSKVASRGQELQRELNTVPKAREQNEMRHNEEKPKKVTFGVDWEQVRFETSWPGRDKPRPETVSDTALYREDHGNELPRPLASFEGSSTDPSSDGRFLFSSQDSSSSSRRSMPESPGEYTG